MSLDFKNKDCVVNSTISALPLLSGRKRRIVITYGLAHHVMRAVLKPDVPSAIAARDIRAPIGSPESTRNSKGERHVVSAIEDNEKIFKLRKALVNGPWYTNLSSVALHSLIGHSMSELTPACPCVEEVEKRCDWLQILLGVLKENRRFGGELYKIVHRRVACIAMVDD